MLEFGNRLRMIRKEKGLTLKDLGASIGTSKSLLSRYENGEVYPTLDTAVEIANFFHVSLDWIAGVSDIDGHRMVTNSSDYMKVFDKCIMMNIAPEKLNTMIDLLKG